MDARPTAPSSPSSGSLPSSFRPRPASYDRWRRGSGSAVGSRSWKAPCSTFEVNRRQMAIMSSPSYAHGASPVELLGETIGDNLRRTVERHGDREALVSRHQGFRASYREFWDLTSRCAKGLVSHGVKKG